MQRPGQKTIEGMSHADLTQFIHNQLATQNPAKAASYDQVDVHGVLNIKDKLNLSPQARASLGIIVPPTGSITAFAAVSAPTGWLLCDGSAVSRTTYATLFALIGTTYGVGDGSTTFNVPNLQGRVPVGKNGATFAALGGTGGEETHQLIAAEMPSHTHTFAGTPLAAHTHTAGSHFYVQTVAGTFVSSGSGFGGSTNTDAASAGTPAGTNSLTGGDGAHNNLQPYLAVNYIIKS